MGHKTTNSTLFGFKRSNRVSINFNNTHRGVHATRRALCSVDRGFNGYRVMESIEDNNIVLKNTLKVLSTLLVILYAYTVLH